MGKVSKKCNKKTTYLKSKKKRKVITKQKKKSDVQVSLKNRKKGDKKSKKVVAIKREMKRAVRKAKVPVDTRN